MSIEIRKAKESDSPFLAQMMLQSSRAGKKDGIFDLIFANADDKTILENLEKLTKTEAKPHCNFNNFLGYLSICLLSAKNSDETSFSTF